MRLTERVHLVGSANEAGAVTDPHDCHVYLVDGGERCALVDAGAGRAPDALVAAIERTGIDPGRVTRLLLTHGHADHAGGAAALRDRLGPGLAVDADPLVADWLGRGDEAGVGLDVARRAGVYPPDYRLRPCAVAGNLADGDVVPVGDVDLRVVATPGHASGHLSFLLEADGRRDLLAGDAVFPGGRVALLPTHDCEISPLVASLRRLRALRLDGLLAGHGTPVTADGQAHVEHANRQLDRLLMPPPLNPTSPC